MKDESDPKVDPDFQDRPDHLDKNISKLLRNAQQPQGPRDGAADRIFSNLKQRLDEETLPHSRKGRPVWRFVSLVAVAAACLLIVLTWSPKPTGIDDPTDPTRVNIDRENGVKVVNVDNKNGLTSRSIKVPVGQDHVETLKDGTRITIEGESHIIVETREAQPRPMLRLLKGAVRSEVSKGLGRYRVQTSLGAAIALGTDFRVSLSNATVELKNTAKLKEEDVQVGTLNKKLARALIMTVAVLSGDVLVVDAAGGEQLASAGDRIVLKKTNEKKVAENVQSSQLVPRLEDGSLGEPLEVRKHTVKVNIDEQVAFVEVDQVFYNPTDRRMEGTFYFPLPPGSTIARLAMYVGDNLMEGEIAETERARRTFEALLVQNQDPALLEWAGGNLFKMRVFPIEPKSEKRVLISYYEVLKKERQRIRFNYPLASNALQTHPVGKIDISVKVKATPEIYSAVVPTHDATVEHNAHSITASYSVEKTHPKKDFRLEYHLAKGAEQLLVVPFWHTKKMEGYFMMIFSPELKEFTSQKDTGNNFVFVMDKSGGLGARHLELAKDTVRRALTYLKPTDRFGIVAYDTFAKQWSPELLDASPENVSKANVWLEKLEALGASDLSRAWQATAKLVPDVLTQVVYVGSGLSSLTSTRTGKLLASAERCLKNKNVRIHALPLGGVQDQGFLSQLVRRFNGTLRPIDGADDMELNVAELLEDYNWPLYRNVELSFGDLDVSEIYPIRLPNVTAGRQLFVFGRYTSPWSGTVKLTAHQGGVEFARTFDVDLGLKTSAHFVPRLWATRKIEHLQIQAGLVGGDTAGKLIRTVIETSKRFRVMSRHTSFIVLETAEDYERFGIERRVDEMLGAGGGGGEAGESVIKEELKKLTKLVKSPMPEVAAQDGSLRNSRRNHSSDKSASTRMNKPRAPSNNRKRSMELAAESINGDSLSLGERDFKGKDRKYAARSGWKKRIDVMAWTRQNIFPKFERPTPGHWYRGWKFGQKRGLDILRGLAARYQSMGGNVTRFTVDQKGKETKFDREWIFSFDIATNALHSQRVGDDHYDICDGSQRVRFFPQLKYVARRAATKHELNSFGALLPGLLFPWTDKIDHDWYVSVVKEDAKTVVLKFAKRNNKNAYWLVHLAGEKGPVTKIEIFVRAYVNRKYRSQRSQTIVCADIVEAGGVKIPTTFKVTTHTGKKSRLTEVVRLKDMKINYKPDPKTFKIEIPKDWAIRDLDKAPATKDRKGQSNSVNPSPNFRR